MSTVNLICIGCPLGCPLTVEMEGNDVKSVAGNTCPRGDAYAKKELTNPTRIVTSTVRVAGGKLAMVSVKTQSDIPKDKIFDCVKALKDAALEEKNKNGLTTMADLDALLKKKRGEI